MKEAIKILNKIYLREVIFATLITLMMIVVSYFTIKKPGFQWSVLLFSIIYNKYLFDSFITHKDKIREIKKIKP